jgi:hypothetical protein
MTRKRMAVAVLVLVLTPGLGRAEELPADLGKARAAIAGLGERLKSELMSAMASGGPVAAIEVCQTAAPALSKAAGDQGGLTVRRTALKVRNPGNAPDDFERRVLEDFAVKIMAGTPPGALEHSEIVTIDGVRTLRYMKPIMMADQPCSVCHGGALADDVKAKVSALYPDDQAIGFKPGDLRGAFSVLQRLD